MRISPTPRVPLRKGTWRGHRRRLETTLGQPRSVDTERFMLGISRKIFGWKLQKQGNCWRAASLRDILKLREEPAFDLGEQVVFYLPRDGQL